MFRDISISRRLIIGFTVTLLLFIGLALISTNRVSMVKSKIETMNNINNVKQRYAINFRGSVHDRSIDVRDVVLSRPEEFEQVVADIDRLTANYAKSAAPLDAMLAPETNPGADEIRILDAIKDVERRTMPVIRQIVELRRSGDVDGARAALLTQARPLFVEWLRTINQFIDFQENRNKEIAADVEARTRAFLFLIAAFCLAGLGFGTMVVRWSMRGIKPLPYITERIGRLGEGNLEIEIPNIDGRDEIGELARATAAFRDRLVEVEHAKRAQAELLVSSIGGALSQLAAGNLAARVEADLSGPFAGLKADYNEAAASLSSALTLVADSASNMSNGSEEIAQASEDLARRTEGTASSLVQTTAAIAQMDERLNTTASNAAQTLARADRAMDVVSSGRTVADEVAQAMARVSQSAEGIDSVIEGLDKIAFQTRVLAMNAAVEAGRAGEAGRGFAVVADLVSALAMRAEDEAKRARDQLTVTQGDIASAVEAVRRVDAVLERITGDVTEVHGLLGAIATDNRAQALTISQVNTAILAMDQATQQNAAMVEQTSAASRNLAFEAERLSRHVAHFGIGIAPALAHAD